MLWRLRCGNAEQLASRAAHAHQRVCMLLRPVARATCTVATVTHEHCGTPRQPQGRRACGVRSRMLCDVRVTSLHLCAKHVANINACVRVPRAAFAGLPSRRPLSECCVSAWYAGVLYHRLGVCAHSLTAHVCARNCGACMTFGHFGPCVSTPAASQVPTMARLPHNRDLALLGLPCLLTRPNVACLCTASTKQAVDTEQQLQ